MTDYVTLDELKDWLSITDDQDDTNLSARITAASAQVDQDCNRPDGFGLAVSATARVYRPTNVEVLLTDDISTTTGLLVEVGWNTSYSALDPSVYELRPENAHARGVPASVISRVFGYWPVYSTPAGYTQQRVRVTAVWGWPAVPAPIKTATMLRAARLYRRRGSPEGVAGFGDMGVVRVARMDPDYDAQIAPYVLDIS